MTKCAVTCVNEGSYSSCDGHSTSLRLSDASFPGSYAWVSVYMCVRTQAQ